MGFQYVISKATKEAMKEGRRNLRSNEGRKGRNDAPSMQRIKNKLKLTENQQKDRKNYFNKPNQLN